jgi:hypothetical protein
MKTKALPMLWFAIVAAAETISGVFVAAYGFAVDIIEDVRHERGQE